MNIDPEIRDWILEYCLRQISDTRTLCSLLLSLPLSNNPTLKKLIILKMLQSEVGRQSVSENLLDYFDQLAKIESEREVETLSDAMKRAFCAVAVECTMMCLKKGEDGHNGPTYSFFDAVRRIWRGKFGNMEKSKEKCGLGCEELWMWKVDIEAALLDDDVCKRIVKNAEAIDAIATIKAYLMEEEKKMGPSFLELPALKVEDMRKHLIRSSFLNRTDRNMGFEALKVTGPTSDYVQNLNVGKYNQLMDQVGEKEVGIANEIASQKMKSVDLASEDDVGGDDKAMRNQVENLSPVAENVPPLNYFHQDTASSESSNRKRTIHPGDRSIGLRRSPRGAKLVNSDGTEAEPLHGQNSLPHSSKVKRVRELLKLSSSDLHAVVKDPLPEALQFAEEVCHITKNKMDQESVEENRVGKKVFICDESGVVQSTSCFPRDVPRTSLMERNHTAHSLEWDDSIEGSDESPLSSQVRRRLPSPVVTKVPPLSIYRANKKRRARRNWSPLEADTLIAGVKEIGRGNWKAILDAYRDVFVGRTDNDLRDKWRNMTGG